MSYEDLIEERETLKKQLSKKSLIHFTKSFTSNYDVAWFNRIIASTIEQFMIDVMNKKSPRLMVFAPPRSGKSQLVSRCAPSWIIGNFPNIEIIVASYSSQLARDFGRWQKRTLNSAYYKEIFSDIIDYNSNSADRIDTVYGGGLKFVGVGGSLTGRGAHLAIIDDPVKGREEADSPAYQTKNWGWYQSVLKTRLAPGGGIIICCTLWSENDIPIKILEDDEEKLKWKILRFKAIADDDELPYRKKGEALHPSRYPLEQLKQIKNSTPIRDWLSLYQQTTSQPEGIYFKHDRLKIFHQLPKEIKCYQAWDLAITEEDKDRGDYSVGVCVSKDEMGNFYILDIKRGRWNAQDLIYEILNFAIKWNPLTIFPENSQIWGSIKGFFNSLMLQKGKLFTVEQVSTARKSKVARSTSLQAMINNHLVYYPSNASWIGDLKEELQKFPSGKHDDQVDALSHAINQFDIMIHNNIRTDISKKENIINQIRGYELVHTPQEKKSVW